MKHLPKTIGIIGGMGPQATADIFQRIISLTPAKQDSDHIHILIDNNPHVPNRVDALLNGGKSPLLELKKMAHKLEDMGADFLIMPCNTASVYTARLRDAVNIPILDIVDEAIAFLFKTKPEISKIGVLGTSATVRLGVYQTRIKDYKVNVITSTKHCKIVDDFSKQIKNRYYKKMVVEDDKIIHIYASQSESRKNFEVISPKADTLENKVQAAISGPKSVKAGNFVSSKKQLTQAITELTQDKVEAIILGCSEIPIVIKQEDFKDVLLIDPTEILTVKAVQLALGT